jgi:hypothetical protein
MQMAVLPIKSQVNLVFWNLTLTCTCQLKIRMKISKRYKWCQHVHLSSLEMDESFEIEKLLDGSPIPSSRISSPPMLLKWFCARVPEIVERRVHKLIKWSDRSDHCSFKLSLWIALKSSAVPYLDLLNKKGNNSWITYMIFH